MTIQKQHVLMGMLLGGVLLLSGSANAQTWTTIASACQPGSSYAGDYHFSAGTLNFASGITGQIVSRCNVTNPKDSGVPGWTTMVVGYQDPDGTGTNYQVDAQLYRVLKSTGAYGLIKTFDSSSFSGTGATSHSVTFTHTFDFTNYAYWVELTLTRGDTASNPAVWFVALK